MNANAIRLYSENHNNDGNSKPIWKYKLSCQETLNKHLPNTRDWLELVSRINHDSPEYILFHALLNKHDVVVKVGPSILQKEWSIGKSLETLNLPTFLPYNCIFKCLDDVSSLKRNPMPTHLCRVTGEELNILVMPELKGHSIANYRWTPETFHIVQNILKHVITSLCVASAKLKFVHRDLHLSNVLLIRTKRSEVCYGDYGTLPVLGYLPIIFDYDMADIDSKKPYEVYNKDIQRYILDVDKECTLKFRTDDIKQLISDITWNKHLATPELCGVLIKAIDTLSLILPRK